MGRSVWPSEILQTLLRPCVILGFPTDAVGSAFQIETAHLSLSCTETDPRTITDVRNQYS